MVSENMTEPTNMELMRAIERIDEKIDKEIGEVQICLWGAERNNGIVTATADNCRRLDRIEKTLYGIIGAFGALIVGVGIAIITGGM